MPSAYAFLIAFVAAIVTGPWVIRALKRVKMGQKISEDGPESHQAKAGTPTMGGLIILLGVLAGLLSVVLIGPSRDYTHLAAVVVLMCAFALLGFVDDYLTVRPLRGVRGISSKPKALLQIILAVGFVLWLSRSGHSTELRAFGSLILSGVWYQVFAVVFIVGMANFVNITDGLDGLVAGLTLLVCLPLLACMSVANELGFLVTALAGGCLGFLWFNANPARVFMGDTGSLAIGTALPAIALVNHYEVALIIAGAVFILDGLSSALQWAVFKYTRIRTGTGRRVFLKSPVHHHFEMAGWPEQTVVVRFWICGVIAAALGYAGAAMRWW